MGIENIDDIADMANGFKGFAGGLGLDGTSRQVEDAIKDAVDRVVKHYMEPTARSMAPKQTGQLASAIGSTIGHYEGDTYKITLEVDEEQVPHLPYVVKGTSETIITPKGRPNNKDWAKDRLGSANRPFETAMQLPSLKFTVGGQVVYTNFVRHPGTPAQDDFLKRAAEMHRATLRAEIKKELVEVAIRNGLDPDIDV